jgi:hypothetical protein
MSRNATSNEVLRMIVGLRLEVGVGMTEIRDVIDQFSSDQRPRGATGETAGFLSVEDIPQHLRREFAAALAALSGQGDYRQSPSAGRTLSVTDIWG